jgi:hypothetical protein
MPCDVSRALFAAPVGAALAAIFKRPLFGDSPLRDGKIHRYRDISQPYPYGLVDAQAIVMAGWQISRHLA